jgi:UDP-N-acetylmuramyl pentapeptide phosphotransferase/UDP-N-acetylglucosamine-1-phosphate transferase
MSFVFCVFLSQSQRSDDEMKKRLKRKLRNLQIDYVRVVVVVVVVVVDNTMMEIDGFDAVCSMLLVVVVAAAAVLVFCYCCCCVHGTKVDDVLLVQFRLYVVCCVDKQTNKY